MNGVFKASIFMISITFGITIHFYNLIYSKCYAFSFIRGLLLLFYYYFIISLYSLIWPMHGVFKASLFMISITFGATIHIHNLIYSKGYAFSFICGLLLKLFYEVFNIY